MAKKIKIKKSPNKNTIVQSTEKNNLNLLKALAEENLRCIAFGNNWGPDGGFQK